MTDVYIVLTNNILTTLLVDSILVIEMSNARKYAVWALCIYLAVGLTTGVHGSVLCLTPDEGARIEVVCQTSCGDAENSCEAEQPGVEAEAHPHCIGCTDIPLSYDSLIRRDFVASLVDDSSLLLSPAPVTPAESVDLTATRIPVLPNRGPLISPLLSLSTTILIC